MEKVRFDLQVVHADGTFGAHVRVRVGVGGGWVHVEAKMNTKIAAAADEEDVTNAVFASGAGAHIMEADDIEGGETAYALLDGAEVPGSGSGGGGSGKGKGKGKAKAKAEAVKEEQHPGPSDTVIWRKCLEGGSPGVIAGTMAGDPPPGTREGCE
eukprot:g7651.t1